MVKQVEKWMKENDKTIKSHFFYYDAWLHQSALPRRSFLEAFF